MKQRVRKVVRFFVMAAVFAAGMVFGGETGKAAETAAVVPVEAVDETFSVTSVENRSYEVPAYTDYEQPETQRGTIVPVTIAKAGELFIRINKSQIASSVTVSLWTDKTCKDYPASNDASAYVEPNEVKNISFSVASAGTYYMLISYSYSQSTSVAGSVEMASYFVSRADRDLMLDKWSALAPEAGDYVTYGKVTVEQDGYIGVAQANETGDSVTYAVCDDKKTVLAEKAIDAGNVYYYPVSKGTYYLKTAGDTGVSYMKYSFVSGFSAKEGEAFSIPVMAETQFDVQFTAEKTGVLSLWQQGLSSCYVTFLNEKKQAISEDDFNWGDVTSVAVKKGTVYYVRLNCTIGTDTRVLGYTISTGKIYKNTSKKKAVALKKKAVKAVILSGDTKWHYFKLNMKKKKALKMTMQAEGNGNYDYQLITKKGKMISLRFDSEKQILRTYGKIAKGTYYLCVKNNELGSGRYTLKL